MKTSKLLKQGDTGEDGFIFTSYRPNGSAQWRSPASYHRHKLNVAVGAARDRAKKVGLPFDIDADYLEQIFPSDWKCPALGIPMAWGGDIQNSPSVDRVKPHLGYVRGNIAIISQRANRIKADATSDELVRVAEYLKEIDYR